MELYNHKSITLDDTTKSLADDAVELARNVHEIRPLPEDVLKTVTMKLLGDRIYNSNAIEGNLLTLRETVAILQAGANVTLRHQREADEVIGMKNAIDRIQPLFKRRGMEFLE
jgi:Fic family protein